MTQISDPLHNAGSAIIIGADSSLGSAALESLRLDGKDVWSTTRRKENITGNCIYLDLSQDVSDWRLPSNTISSAVVCAAITSVSECSQDPDKAVWVNVHNTVKLADKLTANGVFVVYPSTNLVYDGSVPKREASDPVCPTTEYGRQKAEVERQLLAYGDLACVVRFTKILSRDLLLFTGWIESLRSGNLIHPFSDMVMAPISLNFAVEVLMKVIHSRLPGIVQVSASEDISYAQLAYYIAMRLGVREDLIQPIASGNSTLPLYATPLNTTLDLNRLRSDFGLEPPDVWATVDSVFKL